MDSPLPPSGLPETAPAGLPAPQPHRRRPRYRGTHPRRFEEKYKEHDPARHAETVAKVIASGKTPAGTHRPIMVAEILEVLRPAPGLLGVDCTLGYGGHAEAVLPRLRPGGRLVGIDVDAAQLPRTEARLRGLGHGPEEFGVHRSNFAGLPKVLAQVGVDGVDLLLADLGVSSMQIDDPARGFSVKLDGPLDMRMNPGKGPSAADLLTKLDAARLAALLLDHADEPHAARIAPALAGRRLGTTRELAEAVKRCVGPAKPEEIELTLRRVFQALRIAVNDEFSALDTLLRHIPGCLRPGGRVAILTFHSGEDRRVKKAFESGLHSGVYRDIGPEVLRPSPEERRSNPRSGPAKLRWAIRADPVAPDRS